MKLMKRIISIVLCACMILGVQIYQPVLAEDTTSEIIEIRTIDDLYNINNNMSGNYKLMNDIDMTEATAEGGDWDYMGNGWDPIGSGGKYTSGEFSGTFDGNGYSIKGMRIEVNSVPSGAGSCLYLGLFANNIGTITNLTVEGTIIVPEVSKYMVVGMIAANNYNIISNCTTIGNINTNSQYKGYYVEDVCIGGVVGFNNCSITGCKNYADIYAKANTSSSELGVILKVGGIAGHSYYYGETSKSRYWRNVYISNSFNASKSIVSEYGYTKSDYNYVGGILGHAEGGSNNAANGGYSYVENCYNTSDVSGDGIIGYCETYNESTKREKVNYCYNTGSAGEYAIANTIVTNCYYLSGTGETYGGAKSLTEAQMKLQSTYSGFDFYETWIIDSITSYKYPQLRNNRQETEKEIDIIEIKSLPSKLAYYTDATVDTTGGVITAYYIDGISENIDITADMISGYDMTQTGTQTVTVTYRGHTLTYEINVTQKPNVLNVSQISGPTKMEFVRGTTFDFSGWKVQVVYDNGTSEVIDIDPSMTTGGDINSSGTYTVTYTLEGKSVSALITVVPVKVTGVEIVSLPNKLTYIERQPLDTTGLVVAATYNNGNRAIVTDYTVSGYSSEIGTHTVTVTYSDLETTFDVTVDEGAAIALSVASLPTKTQYVEGQSFDPSGMVVEAVYADGFTRKITNYTVSKMSSSAGTQNLIVSYQDVVTYISVTVIRKQLQSLEITRLPNKTTYIEGEKFSSTGLVVSGLYNDGTTSEITGYALSGANTTTVGSKIVTVTYSGKTTTFAIAVVEPTLLSIEVVDPTKTSYILGEEFDATGMTVTANYNNGKVVEVTDYQISGFTGETGANVIMVTYEDQTWTFVVTVHEPYGDWVVTKEATCTTAGEKIKYCLECNEVAVTEIIKESGHTEVIDKAIDATCTESGLTEGSHCSVCEEVLVEQEIVSATGHSPSAKWETIEHATCTETGIQVKKCTVCGETVASKDVDSKGHIVVTDKGYEPTCTESGLTEGSHCSECGEVLVAQKNISPTGHSESADWKTTKEATCTDEGTKIKYCTECDEILETESIDSLGHEFINYRSNNDATCTADGTKTASCSNGCGEKDTIIDAGSMTEHTVIVDKAVEVTCIQNGKTEGSHCFECGEVFVEQKVIPTLGHTASVKWEVISNATCTAVGTQAKKCTECGETLETKAIEATGHTEITSGVKTVTYFEEGYTGDKVCSTCKTIIAKGTSIAKLVLEKPVIKKVKPGKKNVKVKFGKVAGATQYEIRVKVGKKWKTYTTKKAKYTIRKLKKGKKYKIQVRAMAVSGNIKVYSSYSKKAKAKVK